MELHGTSNGDGPAGRLTDPDDAERRVCTAIVDLGRLAGIDVDGGDGPEDIDGSLIQAAYECHFDDPQCLGGRGGFAAAATVAQVRVIAARAGVVTRGLLRYLEKRAPADTLARAHRGVGVIDATFSWLEQAVERR